MPPLSPDELTLIGIVVVAFVVILSNRIPADLTALLVLLTLSLAGLVTPDEALSGFSSSIVITIIGLFVITHALEQAGVIQWVAQRVNRLAQGSEVRLIALFMVIGAGLSLVMNNIAAGAVLLPAAVQVGRISQVPLSKLLIPLSFGTLVGGMATYLTTANIVMSGLLEKQGLPTLGMIDFVPTGGLIVIAGLGYMLTLGRHMLPTNDTLSRSVISTGDLQRTYQLDERMWEVRVLPGSPLVGAKLRHSGIGEKLGLTVLAIWHGRRAIFSPAPTETIRANDILLVLGRQERVEALFEWGTELRNAHANGRQEFSVDLTEVIIPPRSTAVGQTLTQLRHRDRFGLTAVALWREGRSYRTDVGKMPLQVGDALLMVGPPDKVRRLANERDYLVPSRGYGAQVFRPRQAFWSILITTLVVIAATLNLFALPLMMLIGAAGMVLTRCLTMDEAYQAVEWRVIFLIAGMLPLSIALVETGLAGRVSSLLSAGLSDASPLILIAAIFTLTTLVTQVIGGQVTALVVGPIAIATALDMGISPQAVGVTVAIACSTAFLTPIAHPVNVLMMGPGGYKFSDFFRVGLGMTLVTLVMLLVGMALFWGLG